MDKKIIATNRRARYQYHILDTIEAGLVLQGTEVKAIREGKVTLTEGYARFIGTELYLINVNIGSYSHTGSYGHPNVRDRKLLVSRRELNKLHKALAIKGQTLIPLSLYLRRGWIKIELGIGRGKQLHDKRQSVAERESKRQLDRETKTRI